VTKARIGHVDVGTVVGCSAVLHTERSAVVLVRSKHWGSERVFPHEWKLASNAKSKVLRPAAPLSRCPSGRAAAGQRSAVTLPDWPWLRRLRKT